MSDYIPTTKQVKADYSYAETPVRHSYGFTSKDYDAEFDRWLAEVKAQAWADGYTAGTHDWRTERLTTRNPYRGENK